MSEPRRTVDDQQLGDYLLGEADERERASVERALAEDPQLRDRVRKLEALTETLSTMSGPAWQEALSAHHPGLGREAAGGRRSWTVTMPGVAVAGLAALILFIVGIGVGSLTSPSSTTVTVTPSRGTQVALHPLAGGPTDVSGDAYLAAENRMVLIIHRLPATQPGDYYEAWLMTNIRQLVPIASFRVDANGEARLILQLPADATSYRYVDISLQSIAAGQTHSDCVGTARRDDLTPPSGRQRGAAECERACEDQRDGADREQDPEVSSTDPGGEDEHGREGGDQHAGVRCDVLGDACDHREPEHPRDRLRRHGPGAEQQQAQTGEQDHGADQRGDGRQVQMKPR